MRHEIGTSGLSVTDSKRALSEAYEVYSRQYSEYNPALRWKSDHLAELSFSVKGYKVTAHVLADDGRLILDCNLPWYAKPFEGKALAIIKDEVDIWVQRIKAAQNESV